MENTARKLSPQKCLTGAKRKWALYGISSLLFMNSCGVQQSQLSDHNLVKADRRADQRIGDHENSIHVVGAELYKEQLREEGSLLTAEEAKTLLADYLKAADEEEGVEAEAPQNDVDAALNVAPESLIVGLPMDMLTEEHLFGAVITKVSNRESDSLGRLKLSDLAPMNVKPFFYEDRNDELGFILVGCARDCNDQSEDEGLMAFPLVGYNEETNLFYLDFSRVGEGLNLAQIMDSRETMFRTTRSRTVLVDYSDSTLVFDVESRMTSVGRDAEWDEVDVTTRWYITLRNKEDPQFVTRNPTPGVGFFGTERSSQEKINRFALNDAQGNSQLVKYYIKNVPEEYQASFAQALEDWNVVFSEEIGRNLFEYEFVSVEDPRNELLVPGDPRHQVIEWDLYNNAPYGGLGPNIADQKTGQILTANVLIQGPSIVKLYTEWFGVSQEAHQLRAEGHEEAAQRLVEAARRDIFAELNRKQKGQVSMSLGSLNFDIKAQNSRLQDPVLRPLQFDLVPEGMSYEEYMFGYFREMLAHELGHNIGLRHNFRGNLAASDRLVEGEVSNSVMEYLGRTHRHLNMISSYDRMAIRYGYAGHLPQELGLFCTDEDVGTLSNFERGVPGGSAECSRNDAGSDPFSYFAAKLKKVSELLVNKGSEETPLWNMDEISRQYNDSLTGMILYENRARVDSRNWTNFFGKEGRPGRNVSDVKAYVQDSLLDVICDPSLSEDVSENKQGEAAQVARENLAQFQEDALSKLTQYTSLRQADCH